MMTSQFILRGEWEEARRSKGQGHGNNHLELDDGNLEYCVVCEEGGKIVCCSNCPRSYHEKCLAKEGCVLSVDSLPTDWRCVRCDENDGRILPEEEILSDGSDVLSDVALILNKLQAIEFGYVFSEPIDVDAVPDYLVKVKVPMDYGTITKKLKSGEYNEGNESAKLDAMILGVLCDIERVHLNCQLYNSKGSSLYRASQAQAKKWDAYLAKYIAPRLSGNVIAELYSFRRSMSASLESRVDRNEVPQQRQQPEVKKTKQRDSVLPSKVMLTDDQIQSLEHVFFSEPKALAEEVAAKREANEPFENTFYAQWYERLNDVKKHKIQHGTAVVSTALDEKLYHWNLRECCNRTFHHIAAFDLIISLSHRSFNRHLGTRKRYHFTLFHKPHLKSSRSSRMDGEVDDAGWLLKMPNMTGSFVLSTASARAVSPSGVYPKKKYPTLLDENTDLDSETAFEIHHKHIQQVYFPEQPFHSSSLFWDECLEELRFFHGDNNHTIIPRVSRYMTQRVFALIHVDAHICSFVPSC